MKNESLLLSINKAKENNFLYNSSIENISEFLECTETPEWIVNVSNYCGHNEND